MGGEEGADKYDSNVRYRSCLTNYVIDTGKEVILVDTGVPKESPEQVPDSNTAIYTGRCITDYVSALKAVGYTPDQVSKILVTHKHEDHTGELRSFPNAKIYISPEDADALELKGDNIIRVQYKDGPYYNFSASGTMQSGGKSFLRASTRYSHINHHCVAERAAQQIFCIVRGDHSVAVKVILCDRIVG